MTQLHDSYTGTRMSHTQISMQSFNLMSGWTVNNTCMTLLRIGPINHDRIHVAVGSCRVQQTVLRKPRPSMFTASPFRKVCPTWSVSQVIWKLIYADKGLVPSARPKGNFACMSCSPTTLPFIFLAHSRLFIWTCHVYCTPLSSVTTISSTIGTSAVSPQKYENFSRGQNVTKVPIQ